MNILGPMESYAAEYMEAILRSEHYGISSPLSRIIVRKDCVDLARLTPVLQGFLGDYTLEDIATRPIELHYRLIPLLHEKLGIPFNFTVGWFDDNGKHVYRHDEKLIEELLTGMKSDHYLNGLPIHSWLTSPAFEILDVGLHSLLAHVTGKPDHAGGVIYYSNTEQKPEIIYHPTVVGEDFLERIGATVSLD